MLPDIRGRGTELVVVGSGAPEHIGPFRQATGYHGLLYTDPSLRTFETAGLAYGIRQTFHPLTLLRGIRAFKSGFRQGARRGHPLQQGGTFVLGPGEVVRFEWRDRFAGDHPDLREVLKTV